MPKQEDKMFKYLIVFLLLPISFISIAQEYKFNKYGQEHGLTDVFVNTINQDENGYLIVGTSQGVGFYDGSHFFMTTKEEGLIDNFISSSFKDSKGNIWFGHNQGGVTKYFNEDFETFHTGEGIGSVINGIQEDSKGNIWCSTQFFGLFSIGDGKKITFFNEKFEEKMISSLFIDENDFLFISVDGALEVYRFLDTEKGRVLSKIQNISGIEDDVVKIIKLEDGRLLAATRSSGLYSIVQKENIFIENPIQILNLEEDLMIQDVYVNSGRLWISTYGSGVLRTILTNNNCFITEIYTNSNGLIGGNNIKTTYIDREGVLWLGTAGDGLFSKEDNLFTFYFRDKVNEYDASYVDVTETEIWVARDGKLDCYDKQYGKMKFSFDNINSGLPEDKISCFHFIKDSIIVIGTNTEGFYYKYYNDTKFSKFELSDDALSNHVMSLDVDDKNIWVGTQNGVFKVNIVANEVKKFSMSDGLSHNSVRNIFVGKNNEVYVGTNSAFLNIIKDNKVTKMAFKTADSDDYLSVSVTKIVEDNKGDIWISSSGQGIFCFQDTSILHFDTRDGLLNNYCYGIAIDDKNKIWISHDGGLSSIADITRKIEVFDSRYGLNTKFSVSAIDYLDNEIWFGTQNGVVKYDSKEALKNSVPPITSFRSISINDDKVTKVLSDTTIPSGEHNLEFTFKGISLKNSKGLKYKYILEGYDDDWSDFTQSDAVKYTKVREGDYVFKVKSFNDDGVVGNMKEIRVSIKLPYYKQWWFYPLLLFIIVAIVVGIVKYRERQQQKYLKNLSNELDLRTSELVEQKEKMEEINKDLTDSINYAQRIQSAILPEEELVQRLFPRNFIMFKPRDIVSGDFYWVTEYSGKKIIVFADCTGHGVPGGFMSMIGRILLRETCTVKKLVDPGEILTEIDNGLVNVLRQKDDIDSNKDGMDLGVCVIDTDTDLMSYAGAMRPLYIYRDGVRNTLKGCRHSVGGISQIGKTFKTQEFQLIKEDILYMFSDGFPDQFGGVKGRKMKISVLNELLDQVCLLPFEKQGDEIITFFDTWKKNESQMDDVLMLGLQI